ncbi:MAG: hypothetical protein KBG15_20765 [Kofleriaceae bacterium]|nr:hypothetical protein [Kofleriaceae bacterium]
MSLTYKFVEVSIVSDDMIEKCVNQWVHAGWEFDDIRFVTSNASRRPVMAFVSFVRDDVAVAGTLATAAVASAGEAAAGDDQVGPSASSGAASPMVRSRNALEALIARDEE